MRRLVTRYSKLLRFSTVLPLPVTHALMILAAVAGAPGWFLGAAVASYVAEPLVYRYFQDADRPLRLGELGAAARVLIRQGSFVLLLVEAGGVGDATVATAALGFFLLNGLRAGALIGSAVLRRANSLPYATRNLGAGEPAHPPAEPAWHVRLVTLIEGYADLPPLALGAVGLLADVPALVIVGLLGSAAGTLVSYAAQIPQLRQMRRLFNGRRVGKDVQRRVAGYGPEVVLYFTGMAVNCYQANMWLETLERLDRKALVLVRTPEVVAALAPTRLPIVCVSRAEDMMNFDWSTVRVALYTGNTGKNLHLLREPDIKHVFVGHGDSDKDSSSNPVSKVFDEVWVAGPAGRDRYRNSDAGVRDEAIIEVGRPQLTGITTGPTGNDVPTVLYAPTWEGWDSEHSYCSLLTMGDRIVSRLLEQGAGLRVIYRPHPYTGTRMAAAHAAHNRVIAMIEAANQAGGAHRVVTGAEASLHDCFNQSDMLITDISSVISDYMPSLKPYVVTNPHAANDVTFRTDFPSASAAYLLGPDCAELTDIIAVAASPGADPLADERHRLRDYLLGPEHPDAMTRFATAVDTLAAAGPRSTLHTHGDPRRTAPAEPA
ncbi:hypothetical protein GCM10022254_36970 [Actinomadura meridiana]|uniref:CDP-Glycerol:Poly(Glycerophosphate) glycerophosphotransferase n=1 Tax=Actinomadura meridiana TaxID=559626 RepID=A0ABP8C4Y2_9ACTN